MPMQICVHPPEMLRKTRIESVFFLKIVESDYQRNRSDKREQTMSGREKILMVYCNYSEGDG